MSGTEMKVAASGMVEGGGKGMAGMSSGAANLKEVLGPEVLGPVVLEPTLVERIWGVESLPAWFPKSTGGKPIGEAWLTAESCVVGGTDGMLDGLTLGALAARFPERFGNKEGHGFPLLLKLLFPREKLSVQVHPNDAEAQAIGFPRGKTECWYVLDAEPGAEVAVGLREPMTSAAVRAAIAGETMEGKLRYLPVRAGDMVFVDAGTVHAIGPGMTVLETQQYSDITYRLYDYGRPRELHVEAGLGVTKAQTKAGMVTPRAMDGFVRLAESPYFVVDRFDLAAGESRALGRAGELQVVIALGEGMALEAEAGVAERVGVAAVEKVELAAGHAAVLAGGLGGYWVSAAKGGQVVRVVEG